MSGSLKEQLLALGLAPRPDRHKRRKHTPDGSTESRPARGEISLDKAFRMREQAERRARAQALKAHREKERQRRQTNGKIRCLIDAHAVCGDGAERKRYFLYKGRIRSVRATTEQIHALNEGRLGVVFLKGNYFLLPADKVSEIQAFAPDHVPDMEGSERPDEQDYPVPDDLLW